MHDHVFEGQFADNLFAETDGKCDAAVSGSHSQKPLVTVSKKLRTLISRCPRWETLFLV